MTSYDVIQYTNFFCTQICSTFQNSKDLHENFLNSSLTMPFLKSLQHLARKIFCCFPEQENQENHNWCDDHQDHTKPVEPHTVRIGGGNNDDHQISGTTSHGQLRLEVSSEHRPDRLVDDLQNHLPLHNCERFSHITHTPPPRSTCFEPKLHQEKPCKNVKLFQRRAKQRWCRLVSASASRLAEAGVRSALGSHWNDFVNYAKTNFQPQWVQAFGQNMPCQGPLHSDRPCPHQTCIDPRNQSHLKWMSSLHLDHDIPLHTICSTWINIIQCQSQPLSSWDQGVNGDLVCQLLFGVYDHPRFVETGNRLWKANIHFRCYDNQKKSGCHDITCHANTGTLLSTDIIA